MFSQPPTVYPELPWSVDAQIQEALCDRLRGDQVLAAIFGPDGIHVVEQREILTQETIRPPFLGLYLVADREGRATSSYGAEQETVLACALLTSPPKGLTDTQEHLRSRLVTRLRKLIRQDGGELRLPDGRCVATAQTVIDRVNFDQVSLPSQLLLTQLTVRYFTDIDLLTQEVIHD